MTPQPNAGNWLQHVLGLLRARGHGTATSFHLAHPGLTLPELARELGADVLPRQLYKMLYVETGPDEQKIAAFARSCLAMEIRELMPRGWGVDAFEHAHVFGSWSNDVGPEYDPAVDRVFAALDGLAHRGWIPGGPDDPILLRAFERWAP